MTLPLTYTLRSHHCKSAIGKRLLQLLDEKQTNLALSADVTSADELLSLAERLGPVICMLKTHIDIVDDFSPAVTTRLRALADKHRFMIFEDRKFADIGNTVKKQFTRGIFHIADWAHIVNAHVLPGPGIIQGLQDAANSEHHGLVLLAEMSSAGHLMDPEYVAKTVAMARSYPEFVIGFITQRALSDEPNWIYMTPGVKGEISRDTLGQQYVTPETAIIEHQSDIIIVGRGIIESENPLISAKEYRERGWRAYQERTKKNR